MAWAAVLSKAVVLLLLTFCLLSTPIVVVCNCSMFCCMLFYVHSSIAIILMGKRKLIVLLNLSSWCLVMVERLFLAVPRGCLRFVIVVFPDHTHLLFLLSISVIITGPHSAVSNVSGYRYVSDCNFRGLEFDPGPVPYFPGD